MTVSDCLHNLTLRLFPRTWSSFVAPGLLALSLANPGCAATVTPAACSPDKTGDIGCSSDEPFPYSCTGFGVTPPADAGQCDPADDAGLSYCCSPSADGSTEDAPSEEGGGLATCDPSSCNDGCCQNGQCTAQPDDNACGTGGGTCTACAAGTSCNAGTCQ
jgi:hypothetical protein